MQRQHLAQPRRASMCAMCGAKVSLDNVLCDGCQDPRAGTKQRQRLIDALQERRRFGEALGNAGAVLYPAGIDIRLRRLLDTLRQYQIEVRVEVSNRFDPTETPIIYDGHLRRVGDQTEWCARSLGLFADATDAEPTYALDEADFDRLLNITLIDPLVIGRSTPRLIWQAPVERLDLHAYHRGQKRQREHRATAWFAVHVSLVIAVIVSVGVAFAVSLFGDDVQRTVGWGTTLLISATAVGSTLGCWDSWPSLSSLRKTH